MESENPRETEVLTAIPKPDGIRRLIPMLEKHPVVLALSASILFGLIHGIGFIVTTIHFGEIGVPIEKFVVGPRTFEVGSLPILMFAILCGILICGWKAGRQIRLVVIDLLRALKLLYQIAFKKRESTEALNASIEWRALYSWQSFFRRNTILVVVAFVFYYLGTGFAKPLSQFLQSMFPGLRLTNTEVARLLYIVVSVSGILALLVPQKADSEAESKTNHQLLPDSTRKDFRVLELLREHSGRILFFLIFVLWILIFSTDLYRHMLSELGGGMPRTATVHIKTEYCGELELNCPSTTSSTVEIEALIYYEDDQEYRLSKADDPAPRNIHVVKKEYVTILTISPLPKTP